MTPLVLLLLLIGTGYRIGRLVRADTIAERPREALFDRFPPTAERAQTIHVWNPSTRSVGFKLRTTPGPKPSRLAKLLICPWCLSFWVAGALVAAVQPWTSTPLPLLWWTAVSTGIGVIAQVGG